MRVPNTTLMCNMCTTLLYSLNAVCFNSLVAPVLSIWLSLVPSPPILTSQATHHINLWNRNKDILKVWMKDGHSSRKGRIFQNLIEYFVKCTYICFCVESVLVKLWSMGGCSWGRNARVHTQWGGASRSKDSSEEGKKTLTTETCTCHFVRFLVQSIVSRANSFSS